NTVNRTPNAPFALPVHSGIQPATGDEPGPFDVWSHHEPVLRWTPEEHRRGEQLLETLGVPRGAPFVCFLARDGSYLDASFPRRGASYAYHDYRNATIENYLPAV